MGRRGSRAAEREARRKAMLAVDPEAWKKAVEFVEFVHRRIGTTPRDRLAWVVGLVQRNPKEMTPGDRENLGLELAGFYHFEARAKGEPYIYSDEEVQEVLRAFGVVIERAVQRERISVGGIMQEVEKAFAGKGGRPQHPHRPGDILTDLAVVWDDQGGRFIPWEAEVAAWTTRAVRALVRLIMGYGHLVKECPAPAPRGEEGETCGTWFVAKRPNQEYCSATCQSRATTRANRTGSDTPVMAKRRAMAEEAARAKARRVRKR